MGAGRSTVGSVRRSAPQFRTPPVTLTPRPACRRILGRARDDAAVPGRPAPPVRARPARTCVGADPDPVHACGVCRTDLHVVDGELPEPKLPLVPGHEIVGTVVEAGAGVDGLAPGDRVGVPWLGWTCGDVPVLPLRPREPVRPRAVHRLQHGRRLRGVHRGGRAVLLPAPARVQRRRTRRRCSAPGSSAIAALAAAGDAERLGIYGFGAAAHIVAQVARHRAAGCSPSPARVTWRARRFARELGAEWAGGSTERPPEPLDAAIIFAPVGALGARRAARGRARAAPWCARASTCAPIPSFPYRSSGASGWCDRWPT